MTSTSDPNVIVRETTTGVLGDGFDLALLHIDPVTTIPPLLLATPDNKPSHRKGTIATAVGWGGNPPGSTADDPGNLLVGKQKVDDQIYSQAQALASVRDAKEDIPSAGYNYLMKTLPMSFTDPNCTPIQDPENGPPSAATPPRSCASRYIMVGGDSGGPLIGQRIENGQDVPILIGVASQGNKSDDGAYTKVSSTFVWILDHIREP